MSVGIDTTRKQPVSAMPSPPRERGRPRTRGSETEFVLFIQGIPAHCRWQELKDLVRQTAMHIRQAVVYDDQHGFPTGLGQIIVKNEDEAWRTYHRLASSGWDGQSLTVTLSRTSSPTRPIAGPTKSPPCVTQPAFMAGYSTQPRVATNIATSASSHSSSEMPPMPTTPTYHSSDYGPIPSATTIAYPPSLPMTSISIQTPLILSTKGSIAALPQLSTMPSPLYDSPNFPTFSYSPSWIQPAHEVSNISFQNRGRTNFQPVGSERNYQQIYNRHGTHSISPTHYTPSRYIFVQNIAPQATVQDLKNHLNSAGTVEHCEILEDRRTGRRKGQAKATFQTMEQAKVALATLDNTTLMGARIRVKFDRDAPVSRDSKDAAPVEGSGQAENTQPEPRTTPERTSGEERRDSDSKEPKNGPFVVNGSVARSNKNKNKDVTNTIDYEKQLTSSTNELRIE